ncbi:Imm42 family immunity protein [Nocardia alni]|uniref:Imm42 family immunity protein n=1 Tax=Nocardia alni TaxID=2815723 RepID=UPI001C217F6F|nr:Imm42 family immunity protein [Nocardia alni]
MVLVGDPQRFAVEYELDAAGSDTPPSHWIFGRIRWWCGNQPVGRYESSTAIRYVASAAERILRQDSGRHESDLVDLPAGEVARIVTEALFADNDRSDEQIAADGTRYGPYFVSPRTAAFDPWDIFVVESATHARLIWGQVDHRELHELRLRAGEFAQVLRGFLDTLPLEQAR